MTPSLPRFACLATGVVVAACGVGAWPTVTQSGSAGVVGMAIAAGLSVAGAVAGYLPVAAKAAAALETRAQAWMVGLGLRLFLTMGVLLALWSLGAAWKTPFLVWTGILYALLLGLELVVVARDLARAGRNGRASA